MCVHDVSVTECPTCQEEIQNGHEVQVQPVTVVKNPDAIQIIKEEE